MYPLALLLGSVPLVWKLGPIHQHGEVVGGQEQLRLTLAMPIGEADSSVAGAIFAPCQEEVKATTSDSKDAAG